MFNCVITQFLFSSCSICSSKYFLCFNFQNLRQYSDSICWINFHPFSQDFGSFMCFCFILSWHFMPFGFVYSINSYFLLSEVIHHQLVLKVHYSFLLLDVIHCKDSLERFCLTHSNFYLQNFYLAILRILTNHSFRYHITFLSSVIDSWIHWLFLTSLAWATIQKPQCFKCITAERNFGIMSTKLAH